MTHTSLGTAFILLDNNFNSVSLPYSTYVNRLMVTIEIR